MAKIRLVQRRNKIIEFRNGLEKQISLSLAPIFSQQHKRISRFLRKGNLRRKMNKIVVPVEYAYEEPLSQDEIKLQVARYRTEVVFAEMGEEMWREWAVAVAAAILLVLSRMSSSLEDIENDTWVSRGLPPVELNAEELVSDYESRTGRSMLDIDSTTQEGVKNAVISWYLGAASFSVLMGWIGRWFDDIRISLIAGMEAGDFTSQSALQVIKHHGWEGWQWDAMGEKPCTSPIIIMRGVPYNGCLELHGKKFSVNDPTPPGAAHFNCHCLPTPIVSG